MKFHRLQNPISLSIDELSQLFESGVETVIAQFDKPEAYDNKILKSINEACERFGAQLNVRFYGHYSTEFDCRSLAQLPAVRSLNLDCLMRCANMEAMFELTELEEFAFGVFEADVSTLLENRAFQRVRRLVLSETRKRNIDLSPLASWQYLETLFLQGHTRHIELLVETPKLQKLSLSGIGKQKRLNFISSIRKLRSLTYILGGRDTADELAHDDITNLELMRIRGLSSINLSLFPNLERLRIEDQLRLGALDIASSRKLRHMSVFNCKNLISLRGLPEAKSLESLRIGRTAIELESVFNAIPASVRGLSLYGLGKKADARLQERIKSAGLTSALYIDAP